MSKSELKEGKRGGFQLKTHKHLKGKGEGRQGEKKTSGQVQLYRQLLSQMLFPNGTRIVCRQRLKCPRYAVNLATCSFDVPLCRAPLASPWLQPVNICSIKTNLLNLTPKDTLLLIVSLRQDTEQIWLREETQSLYTVTGHQAVRHHTETYLSKNTSISAESELH